MMRARLRENASTSTGPTVVGCCDGARTSVPRFPQGLRIGPCGTDGLRKLCAQVTPIAFQTGGLAFFWRSVTPVLRTLFPPYYSVISVACATCGLIFINLCGGRYS